jgi:hypothetical protein
MQDAKPSAQVLIVVNWLGNQGYFKCNYYAATTAFKRFFVPILQYRGNIEKKQQPAAMK